MSDQQITCTECGEVFRFTAAEQVFYEERGLASPPKRCKPCRQARKEARGPSAGRGTYSGDPNEYRSPMSGGHSNPWERPPARGPGGPARGAPPVRPAPNAPNPWGDPREYRSPAFASQQPHPPQQHQQPSRTPRPYEAPRSFDRSPRPFDRAPRAGGPSDRSAEARNGRPTFEITCASCSQKARVPFRPTEGRDVFCPECYRARKDSGAEAGAFNANKTDSGTVE